MKHLLLSTVLAVLTLASPLSRADFQLDYPAGELAFAIELSNGIAFVHWDAPGTGDIYTLHSDTIADPLDASLEGASSGFAYWLKALGQDSTGHFHFQVFVNTDGSPSGWIGPIIDDFAL